MTHIGLIGKRINGILLSILISTNNSAVWLVVDKPILILYKELVVPYSIFAVNAHQIMRFSLRRKC